MLIISGAVVRIKRRNGNDWLYLGAVKIGRIVDGDTLEVIRRNGGKDVEYIGLAEMGRALGELGDEKRPPG